MEKKVFGLTIEDVGKIQKSVDDWKDRNSPLYKKCCEGSFVTALDEGSDLLCNDASFAKAFEFSKSNE